MQICEDFAFICCSCRNSEFTIWYLAISRIYARMRRVNALFALLMSVLAFCIKVRLATLFLCKIINSNMPLMLLGIAALGVCLRGELPLELRFPWGKHFCYLALEKRRGATILRVFCGLRIVSHIDSPFSLMCSQCLWDTFDEVNEMKFHVHWLCAICCVLVRVIFKMVYFVFFSSLLQPQSWCFSRLFISSM